MNFLPDGVLKDLRWEPSEVRYHATLADFGWNVENFKAYQWAHYVQCPAGWDERDAKV